MRPTSLYLLEIARRTARARFQQADITAAEYRVPEADVIFSVHALDCCRSERP